MKINQTQKYSYGLKWIFWSGGQEKALIIVESGEIMLEILAATAQVMSHCLTKP